MKLQIQKIVLFISLLLAANGLIGQVCSDCQFIADPLIEIGFTAIKAPVLCEEPGRATIYFSGDGLPQNCVMQEIEIDLGPYMGFGGLITPNSNYSTNAIEGDSKFSVFYHVSGTPPPLSFCMAAKCDLWNLLESGNGETAFLNKKIEVKSCYICKALPNDPPFTSPVCVNGTSYPFNIQYTQAEMAEGGNTYEAEINVPFEVSTTFGLAGNNCNNPTDLALEIEIEEEAVNLENALICIDFENTNYTSATFPPTEIVGNVIRVNLSPGNFQGFNSFCTNNFPGGNGEVTLTVKNLLIEECTGNNLIPVTFTANNCPSLALNGACTYAPECDAQSVSKNNFIKIPEGNPKLEIDWEIVSGGGDGLNFCFDGTPDVEVEFTIQNISEDAATDVALELFFVNWARIRRFEVGSSQSYLYPGQISTFNSNYGFASSGTDECDTPVSQQNFSLFHESMYFDFTCYNNCCTTMPPNTYPPLGLDDADGDGFYDDLLPGNNFKIRVALEGRCPFPEDVTCQSSLPTIDVLWGELFWNKMCEPLPEPLWGLTNPTTVEFIGPPANFDFSDCSQSPDVSAGNTTNIEFCFAEWDIDGFDGNPPQDDLFDLGEFTKTLRLEMNENTNFVLQSISLNGNPITSGISPITEPGISGYEIDLGTMDIPSTEEILCFELVIELENGPGGSGTSGLEFKLIGEWTDCSNPNTCEVLLGCDEMELYPFEECFPIGGDWTCECEVIQTNSFTIERVAPAGGNTCGAYRCDEVEMWIDGILMPTPGANAYAITGGFTLTQIEGLDIFEIEEAQFTVGSSNLPTNTINAMPDPANYGAGQDPVMIYQFQPQFQFIATQPVNIQLYIRATVSEAAIDAIEVPWGSHTIGDLRGFLGLLESGGGSIDYLCSKSQTATFFELYNFDYQLGLSLPSVYQEPNCNEGFPRPYGLVLQYQGGGAADDFPLEDRIPIQFINELEVAIEDADTQLPIETLTFTGFTYEDNKDGNVVTIDFDPPIPNPLVLADIEEVLPDPIDKIVYYGERDLRFEVGGELSCDVGDINFHFRGSYETNAFGSPDCSEVETFDFRVITEINNGDIETYPLNPIIETSCPMSSTKPLQIWVKAPGLEADHVWIQFVIPEGVDMEVLPVDPTDILNSGSAGDIKWFTLANQVPQGGREIQFDYNITSGPCRGRPMALDYYVGKTCFGAEIPPSPLDNPDDPDLCTSHGEFSILLTPSDFIAEVKKCDSPTSFCDGVNFSFWVNNPTNGDVHDLNFKAALADGLKLTEVHYRYDSSPGFSLPTDCNPNGDYAALSDGQVDAMASDVGFFPTSILNQTTPGGGLPGKKMADGDGYRRIHFIAVVTGDCDLESLPISDEVTFIVTASNNCGEELEYTTTFNTEHLDFTCNRPVEATISCVGFDFTSPGSPHVLSVMIDFDESILPCPNQRFQLVLYSPFEGGFPPLTFPGPDPIEIDWSPDPFVVEVPFNTVVTCFGTTQDWITVDLQSDVGPLCGADNCEIPNEPVSLTSGSFAPYELEPFPSQDNGGYYCQSGETTFISVRLSNPERSCTPGNGNLRLQFYCDLECDGMFDELLNTSYFTSPAPGEIENYSVTVPVVACMGNNDCIRVRVAWQEELSNEWCLINNFTAHREFCEEVGPCPDEADFSHAAIEKGLTVNFKNLTAGLSPNARFFWDFGSRGQTSNKEHPSNTYPKEGLYTVTLQIIDGDCELAVRKEIEVGGKGDGKAREKAWIREQHNNIAINSSVFPNPASHRINFHLRTSAAENGEVKIYDLSGRMLFVQKVQIAKDQLFSLEIPIENWPTGMYLLQFEGSENLRYHRFIKGED